MLYKVVDRQGTLITWTTVDTPLQGMLGEHVVTLDGDRPLHLLWLGSTGEQVENNVRTPYQEAVVGSRGDAFALL